MSLKWLVFLLSSLAWSAEQTPNSRLASVSFLAKTNLPYVTVRGELIDPVQAQVAIEGERITHWKVDILADNLTTHLKGRDQHMR